VDTPLETPTESSPQTPTVDEEDDYISSLKIEEPFQTDFIVFNDAGEEVSISDYQGKTVILNFWASWCPPCIDEMPEFEALHKKLDPEETVILALNVTDGQRETKKTANKFLETENIDLNVLYDEELNGATEFGISVIPQTYVIDKEGFVQFGLMGMTDEVVLNAMLERMK
jgi:thiol-disulfide isomerase/thioredoxin